jgi:C-terminal processing protease CtpA/Prc
LAAKATDLIIDLRDNPGGDNSFSDPMVAWFANRPFRFTHQFMLKASAASKAHYAQLRAAGEKDEGVLGLLMRAETAHKNGDCYSFVIPLVEPHPCPRFTGKVFVLQNRRSFSNATSVAALIQDYGFGTILGEETADLPSTYASSVPFKLKRTGFNVSYPKSRIIRISGDTRARGVIPDVPIPPQPIGVSEDRVLGETVVHIRQARKVP